MRNLQMGWDPSPLDQCLWHQVTFVIVVLLITTTNMITRRYRHGAWLATHTDRLSTHVISAIVHLGHKVPIMMIWDQHF